MARTLATERAKAARGGVGKRHRKPKQATVTQPPKKRCQQPCCWKSALGVRCACPGKKGKGRCAKTPKQAAKRARKGGLEDALGLRDALYPGQTVQDGARAQYEARYGTMRRAGQGVRQQPTFVELPPRQRQRQWGRWRRLTVALPACFPAGPHFGSSKSHKTGFDPRRARKRIFGAERFENKRETWL